MHEVWVQGSISSNKITNNTLDSWALSLVLNLVQSILSRTYAKLLILLWPLYDPQIPSLGAPGCSSEKASEAHRHLRRASASWRLWLGTSQKVHQVLPPKNASIHRHVCRSHWSWSRRLVTYHVGCPGRPEERQCIPYLGLW